MLKLFIMSTAVSFCLTFALIMINAIMGVFIGLNYYLTICGVLLIGLSVGLILFDAKLIFSKKKVRKVVRKNNSRKRRLYQNEARRKIS